jgi:uncharacterized protein (TIGR01777 family)
MSAPRRVAISGMGGLVGSALRSRLEAEGRVCLRLVRRAARGDDEIAYDAANGVIDSAKLATVDAVVHLAGEGIATGRWTADRKRRIRSSRVDVTRLIAGALAELPKPPAVLVNASAIGYYGGRGDEPVDEATVPGEGFLPEVCTAWEEAAAPVQAAGVRVAYLRIGIVLARDGGALAKMLPIFRLGLGGKLGSGRQYMSWVSLTDLVSIVRFALDEQEIAGPVNAVAPGAVTNAEFSRLLGRALGRPALLPTPADAPAGRCSRGSGGPAKRGVPLRASRPGRRPPRRARPLIACAAEAPPCPVPRPTPSSPSC